MFDNGLTWNGKRSVSNGNWDTYNLLRRSWTLRNRESCNDSRRLVLPCASILTSPTTWNQARFLLPSLTHASVTGWLATTVPSVSETQDNQLTQGEQDEDRLNPHRS